MNEPDALVHLRVPTALKARWVRKGDRRSDVIVIDFGTVRAIAK